MSTDAADAADGHDEFAGMFSTAATANRNRGTKPPAAGDAPNTATPAKKTTEVKPEKATKPSPGEKLADKTKSQSPASENDESGSEHIPIVEGELLPNAALGPKVRRSAEAAVKRWKPDDEIDGRVVPRLRAIAVSTRVLHGVNGFLIWRVGNDLLRAKELIDRGNFTNFLKEACGMSRSTAYNYMTAAKVFSDAHMISHLSPSTIYKLANAKVPEGKLEELVALQTDEEVLQQLKTVTQTGESAAVNPAAGQAETLKILEGLLARIAGLDSLAQTLPEELRGGVMKPIEELRAKLTQQVKALVPTSAEGGEQ